MRRSEEVTIMSHDRLFNKFRLVKTRSTLIKQIDEVETDQIIDKLYSEGILMQEKQSILSLPTPEKRLRSLLELLEWQIDLEDKNGETKIFDIFIDCLELNLKRKDLVDLLKNVDVNSFLVEGEGEETCSNLAQIKSIIEQAKQVSLTDKVLSQIVRNIGNGWEQAAHSLNIDEARIDRAVEENPNNPEDQKYQVFLEWKRKNTDFDTVQLLEALASNLNSKSVSWEGIQKIFVN